MARTKGMLNLSGNLEVNAGAPLDARTVVPTVADLTNASNFQYKYVGMPVVVQATGDMYILTANDVTVAANWKQVGSGGGGSSYTAGDGIDITNDEISVKAGSNLSFDSSGNLNATDTTYTAGDGIVIEDDEISTDNMPAADMSEIVTPLPSVMSRLPRYSTEEQIVGYWLDGKPIYQKTIYYAGTLTRQGTTTIYTDSNIDKILKYEGFFKFTSGASNISQFTLPYFNLDDNFEISVIAMGKRASSSPTQMDAQVNIKIKGALDNGTANQTYVTIQYTKITD